MSKPFRVGLLGLGTVGQALARLLKVNGDEIARRVGRPIVLTHAFTRDLKRRRDCDLNGVTVVSDPRAISRDAQVDVVVELLGGISPARELILEAIGRGKPVVTANKALLAEDGNQIFSAAREKGVPVEFEAAVAGGIPIIRVLREGLVGNRIDGLAGIVNGTSNFILTQMQERGLEFSVALAEAQSQGFAEADPTFDVEGVDAAHKLAILATLAFGMPLSFSKITIEGIGMVTALDLQLARELGYRIKPLAIAKRESQGVDLRVHPTLVPDHHPLAQVHGVLNSVVVHGNAVGETGYYGKGAGGDATASAVAADIVEIARQAGAAPEHQTPALGFAPDTIREIDVLPIAEVCTAHYLRLRVADTPGVLKAITSILAELEISIEAILQKEPRGQGDATMAIITSVVPEHRFKAALDRIAALDVTRAGSTHLRVEHFKKT